ncbi:hypothetical protein KSP40_PGU009556 [Platanthera guangdongensis]|uniref:Secreted protein n=1 Tax=Platanthera guangdongensis TaxID=2320717 RepID=A0ABR2LNR9_9ASPA
MFFSRFPATFAWLKLRWTLHLMPGRGGWINISVASRWLFCWCVHTFKRVRVQRVDFHGRDCEENGVPSGQAPGLQDHLRPKHRCSPHVRVHWRLRGRLALPAGGGHRHRSRIKSESEKGGKAVRDFLRSAL